MAEKSKISFPKRGEIYIVSFDPTLGAEIRKTRPALVLQNDIANRYSPVTIVAAITSQFDERLFPTDILVRAPEGGVTTNSVVLLNQVRTIDKQRLIKRMGVLRPATMTEVERALQVSLGLVAI